MAKHCDLETKEARRAMARLYHRRGLAVCDIVHMLGNNGLFSADQDYHARRMVVVRDLAAIKKEDNQWFRVSALDAQQALQEYLQQQFFLYEKCVEDGSWGLAMEASKNIAKARGIDVDRPVKIETDLLGFVKSAFERAMAARAQKREEEERIPDVQRLH